jgi:hypothetical protein
MAELAGTWTYRSFNPTYKTGNQTPQKEWELIRAEAVFNLEETDTTLAGTIEWPGPPPGGLNLNGTVRALTLYASFEIVGTGRPDNTGRPGTGTDGWEYHYHGHLTRHWEGEGVDQYQTLAGSVIRVTPHNGQAGHWESAAGEVFSFVAVKQWKMAPLGLTGSWTYRSFLNNPTPIYYPNALQTAHLISQEGVFKLETPNNTHLQGTIELPGGGVLDIGGTVQPAEGGEPPEFTFEGTGRAGTKALGWECRYNGHLTRQWRDGINQVPALVGSVIIRAKPRGEAAPVGSVYPFIAVKQVS